MCCPPDISDYRRVEAVEVHPLPKEVLVGGRLQKYSKLWSTITRDRWVLRTVRDGISLDLIDTPQCNEPFDSAHSLTGRPAQLQACQETVQSYLAKDIIEPVFDNSPGLYAAFFGVPKKDSQELRGCWDGRALNEYIRYEHFKMEGVQTLKDLIQPGDFMTKVDISDAYPHLLVPTHLRHLFRFIWQGTVFQYRSLCFGLSSAPRIFTKVMKPVIEWIRSMGIRCVIYLDDILLLASSAEEARRNTQLTLDLLRYLGLLVKPSKVEAVPTQQIEFLGLQADSVKMLLTVPLDKIKKLQKQIRQTIDLQFVRQLTRRQLAGVIGKVTAMAGAVETAQLHTWPLIHELNKHRSAKWDRSIGTLSVQALSELRWWQTQLWTWNGKTVIPVSHTWVVITDAAKSGWGGWWQHVDRQARPQDETRGFFSRAEGKNSSNWRELTGVSFTIQSAVADLQGHSVLVETDNTTSAAYINHMGGRHWRLNMVAQELWEFCLRHRIKIRAIHRAGVDNVRADRLSREKYDPTGYRLLPEVFRQINRQFGPHTVDLMADRLNTQLPRFISRFPDPLSSGTDVFRSNLAGENGFAHPPPALIARVASLVHRQRAEVTLVTPNWKGPWLPLLKQMSVCPPTLVQYRPDLLTQGHPQAKYQLYNFRQGLLVWRISGRQ